MPGATHNASALITRMAPRMSNDAGVWLKFMGFMGVVARASPRTLPQLAGQRLGTSIQPLDTEQAFARGWRIVARPPARLPAEPSMSAVTEGAEKKSPAERGLLVCRRRLR